ncbi:NADH-quinone oxidoreductase chain M [Neoasaia chiangmaiensis NBRC 101099]|uniref:NADH dehydrogenase n=2 Tax=Neoasaia chiangmaiensis TaxID=320497 RepID=A0A1U9KU95_9PROT|nr:NADH dehydrogenase [Neoasaia chiangmaiensis]GBR39211.1 NADH-quinone oxidoreductase chain M [Neoasaia chiangmaiensis NBRC 101099]
MMLPALVILPLLGGIVAWLVGRNATDSRLPWYVSIATLVIETGLLLATTVAAMSATGPWLAHFSMPWVPLLGIDARLDMDGLSLVLLWLSLILSFLCIVVSARDQHESGLFQAMLLATISGVNGVFVATDMFLFFFFWELMLVPMYVLILQWGHEERQRAAMKFFLFTQGSGLLMLLSVLGLVWVHFQRTGVLTFDYFALANTPMSATLSMVLMLGFFIAFAVKLPVVPLHIWLPDTHTQAPTAGSVLLAGILLKTGGYGLIRFVVMLFPTAAAHFTTWALALGVAGILYGAWLSMVQTDMKRLVAYSSVSHLGFVLIGVFSGTPLGVEGAVVQMVAHGLSTGALFTIVGSLQDRLHTRDMRQMGGLWPMLPHLSAMGLIFSIASLGLPGMGNFVGEFLVLFAVWHVSPLAAVLGTVGLVLSAVYSLTMMGRAFFGPERKDRAALPDFGFRPMVLLGVTLVMLIALGTYPQPVLDLVTPAQAASAPGTALRPMR